MSFADGYVDVATRLVEFRGKHPEGSLQPVNPQEPIRVFTVGDLTFLQYVAAAYRSPDDDRPGIGIAWEPFPGRTPYTKGSEAMVAETSAWGRAIVAALAADTKKGVASADEVRSAEARRQEAAPDTSAAAQALADLALRMPTVEDLRTAVYEQARAGHLFNNTVTDPVTGESVLLSVVIANAKARLVQQATEGDAA